MAAAGGMPPPKTVADLAGSPTGHAPPSPAGRYANPLVSTSAEAKAAMKKLIEVLVAKKDELQAIITECGENQASTSRPPHAVRPTLQVCC